MAYLTLNEQLSAADKFFPGFQWRTYNGDKIVGMNPQTGVPVRVESDAFGRIYTVVIGKQFVEPQEVDRPLGAIKPRWWMRSQGFLPDLAYGAANYYRAGKTVRSIEDKPFTYKPDSYGGSVAWAKPPPQKDPYKGNLDKNGHIRPPNFKLPKFDKPFDAFGGVPNVGKAVEDTFNKVLLTGGILAGVLGLTFIIANRK